MNGNRTVLRWLAVTAVILCLSAASFSQVAVGISVRVGPPPLPIYAQPICPGPGYFWTPGYWAWNDDAGYYWVPGTWVVAPIGMLWTPGYWGWGGGLYAWHGGYWGPHIGFYGGINYGYGYTGVGFAGGEWRGRSFYYNRSVTNVSVTNVTNVYNRTVVVNNTRTTSFNGGRGGIAARPTRQELNVSRERHAAPLAMQTQHERLASQNRQNFAAENHGRPAIAATARPGDFSGRSVIPARAAGGEYRAPAISPREARGPSSPGNRGNSQVSRPFTPPSRNGMSAGSGSHGNQGGPSQIRPNETPRNQTRPGETRPNQTRPNQTRPNETRPNQTSPRQSRPNETRPQNRSESRPYSEPGRTHSAPPPRPSAPQHSEPRQNSRPPSPPPANRSNPPRGGEHQKGR